MLKAKTSTKPAARYKIDQTVQSVCRILNLSVDAVLRSAKIPSSCLSSESKGVTAEEYFALWHGFENLYDGPDLAMSAGVAYAHAPFVPAFFAFSCSPDIRTGLGRLSKFKPLVGPLKILVHETDQKMTMEMRPVRPDLAMPASMALCEMVLFLELCRTQTARPIKPLDLTLPEPGIADIGFFGTAARAANWPSLTLSAEDASLPLVSENPDMWAIFEPKLRRQLAEAIAEAGTCERLRNALLEAIPSGEVSCDQLASRLHMSKRTLQRELRKEGSTYQEILDSTRSDLARHYLESGPDSVDEIALLLGYENPASFYRAFKGWFDTTPSTYRMH